MMIDLIIKDEVAILAVNSILLNVNSYGHHSFNTLIII